jgi:hypothetical protein
MPPRDIHGHGDRGARAWSGTFGNGAEEVGEKLARRADANRDRRTRNPELDDRMAIPLRDVRNESAGDITRVVCELLRDADIELCRERLLETWPVTVELPVQLRAPLATFVRQFADDPAPQHEAMAKLVGQ